MDGICPTDSPKIAGKMQTKHQTADMDDVPYLPAKDGLLARKSGLWAKRKHHFLRKYFGITTKSMSKKWRLVYLDVMAGPGLCKMKETGEEFPGSPFVALDHEFHEYIFIEDNPQLADSLKRRISKHSKANLVKVINKNWVEVADAADCGSTTLRLSWPLLTRPAFPKFP